MLSVTQVPYTGPYGLPESGLKNKGDTNIALKRAMARLDLFPWTPDSWDDSFNRPLSDALAKWDPGHTGYGKGRWEKLRGAKIPATLPHGGEYALDPVAQQLIRDDYLKQHPPAPPYPSLVYPHEKGWHSVSGGYVHETGGIGGNWALDFLAAPGTPVLAVESGVVSRTAGHDPSTGLHGSNRDVFGWSVYLKCSGGFWYYTHFGRLLVTGGQTVRVGQVIGYVGNWPYDTPRSHTHLGYTHFTHSGYIARNKIRSCAAAPRVEARELGV